MMNTIWYMQQTRVSDGYVFKEFDYTKDFQKFI